MGLPTTATYIVLASLTANVIVTLGARSGIVFPLIAAHLFVFFFEIIVKYVKPIMLFVNATPNLINTNIAPVNPSIGITTGIKNVNMWDRTEGKEFARDVPINSFSFTFLSFNPSAKIEYPTVGLKKHTKIDDIEKGFIFKCLVKGSMSSENFFIMPVFIM